MTLIETSSRFVPSLQALPARGAGVLKSAWANYRQHREEQRIIRGLARKPSRLLADMGFDPDAIYAAAGDPLQAEDNLAGRSR